ncbi:MAG: hypothetical protein IJC73_03045 [Lentisphaeria bacterium]|nr:hypothetical protein [Lentisphaeria bacterium]
MNPDVAGYVFLTTAAAVLILLELAAGTFGVILPLAAAVVLYAARTRSRRTTLILAFVCGAVIDLVYGRTSPVSVPALLLGGLIAVQSHRREVGAWIDLLLPVLSGMAGYQVILLLAAWFRGEPGLMALWRTCGVILWGTGVSLLVFAALDWICEWLGLTAILPHRRPGAGRPGRNREPQERS